MEKIMSTAMPLIKDTYSVVRDVKEDVMSLSNKLSSIKAGLVDAENEQVNNQQQKDWCGKLKEAAFDVEDVVETFAAEAYTWKQRYNCLTCLFARVSSRYDAAQKLRLLSKRFEKIAEERQQIHRDNIHVNVGSSETPKNTGFLVDMLDVVGREADKESITNMMLSNAFDTEGDISVIPIIGMGGLGKTTLARLVFDDDRVSAHFMSRIWVCVTPDFDVTRILKEIMQFYSKTRMDDSSTSYLQYQLLEFLEGERFLLVLDDVWTEHISKWNSLRVLLKKGAKGSRVLVTSRIARAGDIMGTQPSYHLGYLPDDKCWSLFQKTAFGIIGGALSSETRKDLEDIGREIVGKCQGLPLAVEAMGGLLRGHTELSKWRQIQRSEIWETEYQNPRADTLKVMAILKLSYDHLPYDLKRCFEYCSLFPKSHGFHKEELVKLWIAQGFIQSSGGDTMEEAGIAYFYELLIRFFFESKLLAIQIVDVKEFLWNLFVQKENRIIRNLHEHSYSIEDFSHLLSKVKSVDISMLDQTSTIDNEEIFIMPNLIHDLAQSMSSPNCRLVKDNGSCSFSEQSRHVSLLSKGVEQRILEIVKNAPKLRSLLLPSGHLKNLGEALDKVFHTLKYLRVLDLSSTQISKLADSIEELKLLRYLDLSRTEIRILPNSIFNLFYLQTLKLLGCLWLSSLPKDLGNLVNLRHLELDDMFWFKLSTLPPSMGNLAGLHNLPVFQVGHENGYGIEELEKMAHLSGTLHISKLEKARNAGAAKLNEKKSLDKLVFEWSDRVVNTQDEATTENSVLEDLQPHSNLKELQILRYMGSEFPAWMKEGRLQNLVSLTLNGCIKCKTLALGQLPKLRALYVKGMQELEKLIEVECGSLRWLKLSNCPELRELPSIFPNLQVFKIKSCNSLRALPVTPALRFLTLVDNLILEDWNELILELEVGHDQGQRETRFQPSLIELLELKVISCPKLQALPKIFAPQKLEISHCELLTTLPPPLNARRLQHLALDGCDDGALVRAIPDTNYLDSLVISSISNISPLPQWPRLPGLKALYIRDCKDLVSLSNGEEGSLRTLTSLKLLSIRNCEKLETLNEELPISLECLIVESCPLLNSFSLNNLPSLTDLYIEDCPMLQSLPEDGLPSPLQHLLIKTCPLLTQGCQNEGGGGPDFPKIEHIPDLEIDSSHIVFPSTSVAKPPVWCFLLLLCCGGSLTSREEGTVKNVATDHNKAQPGEIFLEHKKKKKWADEKTGHSYFMLYARALDISWGNRAHWIWNCFKETSDENIEVAKLLHVCYLDVRGKLNVSELSPEVVYEIVYVVKLTKGAFGWEFPILLRLSLPDGRVQERLVSLLEKPRRQWIELNVGNFQAKNGESGEVGFDIYQHGGHWKKGLIIKGAIFRPKQTTL